MKKTSEIVYFLITLQLLLVGIKYSFAQQQWRFHIAFEDAVGARDTIWLLYDTTATYPGVDMALGEGPVTFNQNIFNVWILNDNSDSTKTSALSYNDYPVHLAYVNAFNYQYPITVQWDTSLFHAAYLPNQQAHINLARIDNDYFFLANNDPPLQAYNMLIDDSAYAPDFNWGSHSQFPMIFHFSYDPTGIENHDSNTLSIFPNPFEQNIIINTNELISKLEIFSIDGKLINSKMFSNSKRLLNYDLPLENLSPGLYILKVTNKENRNHYEKIIKIP